VRRLAAVAAAAAVLAACGGGSSRPGDRTAPDRSDELVLRVVTRGGFAAEASQRGRVPQLSVFVDGRAITLGPTTLEFPGPALPNLQEFRLTREGLARIIDEARNAGLLDDPPPDFGDAGSTDQPTTTVTVSVDGRTRRVDVYALEVDEGLTADQRENRQRLRALIQLAGDADALRAFVVPDSGRRYEPTALAVLIRQSNTTGGEKRAWPLGDLEGMRCVVVRGNDLNSVLEAARSAREDDRWESAGATYALEFRPLLPDQSSCDDVR
jgi:hypothetical protein